MNTGNDELVQREGVVTALSDVIAVDERVFVEITGPAPASLPSRIPPGRKAA